ADVKTGEVAILLLGTHAKKLWRTGEDLSPFGTPGFLWANNNNRDPEVRKEYVAQPHDAPYDLVFSPWNRDLAFNEFYLEHQGNIDAIAAVNLWATSPINRAHACDGKITTSEMARQLVFLAHYGKVTLREKFPGASGRRMPDLPGAIPHLSLGYSVPSPIFITEKLREARAATLRASGDEGDEPELDLDEVAESYRIEARRLWRNTVYPASEAENWLVSGTAAYWEMLHAMAEAAAEEDEEDEDDDEEEEERIEKAAEALSNGLAELNTRYLYTVSREQDLVPVETTRAYDRYGPYRIPRIKGTFALHQLRLLVGNDVFLEIMNAAHDRFARKEITTDQFIAIAEEVADRRLGAFIRQWIERKGLPELHPEVEVSEASGGGWDVAVTVVQEDEPYHLLTSVEMLAGGTRYVRPIEIARARTTAELHVEERPTRVVLNPFHDVPVAYEDFYTWGNFIDDYHNTLIVYGTSRQIEANHTLALRWQTTAADAYVEILPPVVKDSEVTAEELASHDLIVMGHPTDSSLVERMAEQLPVEFEKNLFRWRGTTYAEPDDGLFLVLPNPYNPQRVLYLIVGNSALELYRMTKTYRRGLPSWALYEKDEVVDEGYHRPEGLVFEFAEE
ncbi:MAG: hypothetical protein GY856_47840, partial [bacterium]|nr:hypothetical protein [bacterium]